MYIIVSYYVPLTRLTVRFQAQSHVLGVDLLVVVVLLAVLISRPVHIVIVLSFTILPICR